jgi:hypothetical protein
VNVKLDLSAPAKTMEGEPLMLAPDRPATIRDILITALEHQPSEPDQRGGRRLRPATLAEINERLDLRGLFPPPDATDQTVEINRGNAAKFVQLVLDACPVPTAMAMAALLGATA